MNTNERNSTPVGSERSEERTDRFFLGVAKRLALFAAVSSSLAPLALQAQTEASDSDDEAIFELSPFLVSSEDTNSYGALESNSLTAFRMNLAKMPATAQVFTQTFMEDVAATSVESMLVDYSGTVGYNPNNAGAALDMTGDRNGGQGLGVRGLQASGMKRDGFIGTKNSARTSTGLTDGFSIERVELIEGPQSLLYGAVGGGGVINVVSKRANFENTSGSFRLRLDNYGSKRGSVDYNYGLEKMAIRLSAVYGEGKTERYNLSNQHDFEGIYGQLAYKLTPKVTFRVQHERSDNLSVFNNDTNFNNFLAADDPRRGENPRYLALTGQLDDIANVLDEGLNYGNSASLFGWWSSEKIENEFSSAVVEADLGNGFYAKVTGMYSETDDVRSNSVVNRALLPANFDNNPYNETAIRLRNPGWNHQLDRTRGGQFTLLHEANFDRGKLRGKSQTAAGIEFSKQGPTFGSSGFDEMYYQADENWNAIINPNVTLDYGRIRMPDQFFPIQSGILEEFFVQPGTGRVTIDGVNYVAERRIFTDPARIDDVNLFGTIPNNPTPNNPNGYSGNFNPGGYTNNRLIYMANVTDWFEGRLTTMAGFSVNTFDTKNYGPTGTGPRTTILPERDYWGYSLGANYGFEKVPGLRVYATVSTAGLSAGTTKDYYGNPLQVPKAESPVPEVGLKWQSKDNRFTAQLAYNFTTEVTNEVRNAGSDPFNAVNPNGINGRHNGGDQWINLDREASAASLVVTANPTESWRLRFSATMLDGEISSSVAYDQLYNDQFHSDGTNITYADGTPVMIDPTVTEGAPRDTPLTLAMLNDPSHPYWADPDPNSGSIRNNLLESVLIEVDPSRGQAATGITGLPISDIQYDFVNPHNGTVTVVESGEKNTGLDEYSLNMQNHYSFREGRLKGLAVFFDARATIDNRAYYTTIFPEGGGDSFTAVRELVRMPDRLVFDLGVSYRRKLGDESSNLEWSTQLNIKNLFDKSDVWILPNPSNASQLRARLSDQPRLFVWSNTLYF